MDADMDLNIQEDDSENEEIPPPPRPSKSTDVSNIKSTTSLPPPKAQTAGKKDLTTGPGQKQKSQPQKTASSVVVRRTRSNSTSDADEHIGAGSGETVKKNPGTSAAAAKTVSTASSSSVVPEKRARRFGPEDDPMQFHARPQELSRYLNDIPSNIHHTISLTFPRIIPLIHSLIHLTTTNNDYQHSLSWPRNALKRPHNEMDNDTALSATTTSSSSSSGGRTTNSNNNSSGSAGAEETTNAKKKRPKVAVTSNHIFTRISFSELPLDTRLATHLEKSILDGGMGLLSSTRIQRCRYIPSTYSLSCMHTY